MNYEVNFGTMNGSSLNYSNQSYIIGLLHAAINQVNLLLNMIIIMHILAEPYNIPTRARAKWVSATYLYFKVEFFGRANDLKYSVWQPGHLGWSCQ